VEIGTQDEFVAGLVRDGAQYALGGYLSVCEQQVRLGTNGVGNSGLTTSTMSGSVVRGVRLYSTLLAHN
jgi:hypothetical protein